MTPSSSSSSSSSSKMEFINNKRSLFALISLIFLFLLSSNGVSIFSVKIPSFSSSSSATAINVRPSRNLISLPNHETPSQILNTHFISQTLSPESPLSGTGNPRNFISGETHNVPNTYPDVNPGLDPNTLLPQLRKSHSFEIVSENLSESRNKQILKMLTAFGSTRRRRGEEFPTRVKEYYSSKKSNETSVTSSCRMKFFMTWISSLNSFNERAFHCIESIFKTHPNACVLIVSNSLDSIKGRQILKPFTEKGFKVIAISPDFEFLFKNTMAESWFSKLIRGHIHPGVTPIGQNLSNLLRFSLLYKYGGVYIDFDIMILKSFAKLKNSIGAITIDPNTKNWSRLNNAVLVFDKMHPLVYKFIEEFALTFNGNKWGHNGPYLISRVVSRLQGRPGFNFTVLPPTAFYPVNWDKVRVLFRGAKNETESKLLKMKYEQMRNQSYSVHLWNKQSRWFHIEEGSIVRKILSDYCVFCNATSHDVIATTAIED